MHTKQGSKTKDILSDIKEYVSPALGWDTDLVIDKAKGAYVYDLDGREYLDFSSGTAVVNVGHNNPYVVDRLKNQIDKLIHAGCTYKYETIAELSKRLAEVMPGNINSFFFSNSGAEAVEGALKLARFVTKRQAIIAFEGAFHGRTLATTSITTSNSKYRKFYRPLLPEVYILPFPYAYRLGMSEDEAVDFAINRMNEFFEKVVSPEEVAAIILEPVQGEGGYVPTPYRFMKHIRDITKKHSIMMILDEVQTGFGRTGKMFAIQHYDGIEPDIMAIAKGIADGLSLSAVASTKEIMAKWPTGAHGTTYGGSPISCAAALGVLDAFEKDNLLDKAKDISKYMFERLNQFKEKYEIVGDVRGFGYMIGVEFVKDKQTRQPATEFVNKIRKYALEHSLILISCGKYGNVIRLIPPLVINLEDAKRALDVLEKAIKYVS